MVERPAIVTEDHLTFLDALRASGVTNMWGARIYVEDEFGVSAIVANTILIYWMKSFVERHP